MLSITVQDLVSSLRRERAWTRQLVAAVPEEHFSWAPAKDAFSCGGLVRHLIQSEIFWRRMIESFAAERSYDPLHTLDAAGAATLVAFRPRNLAASEDRRLGGTFAALLESWDAIETATWQALLALDEMALLRRGKHPLSGLELSVWEAMGMLQSHEAYHRGQLSAYLKVLGCPQPPLYLPVAEGT